MKIAIIVDKKNFDRYVNIDKLPADYELLFFDNKQFDENFKMISEPSEIMRAFYIDEIESIMDLNGIEKINNISTSGVAPHFRNIIDNLSDEEFEIWKNYHYSSCERKEVQGYSTHMLYIGKKDDSLK